MDPGAATAEKASFSTVSGWHSVQCCTGFSPIIEGLQSWKIVHGSKKVCEKIFKVVDVIDMFLNEAQEHVCMTSDVGGFGVEKSTKIRRGSGNCLENVAARKRRRMLRIYNSAQVISSAGVF